MTKKEILIDNVIYDVTNFDHPGGSILKFYVNNGSNASNAFHQFHHKSKIAYKYLNSLPKRTCTENNESELSKNFTKFYKELKSEGYLNHVGVKYFIEIPKFF